MNLRFYKYDSRKTDMGEINNKLMLQPEFVYDSNGKITGYKTGGADTVHPFINTKSVVLHCTSTANVVGWGNASSTYDIVINLETKTCSIINYTGKDLSGSATTTKAPTTSISSAGFNN